MRIKSLVGRVLLRAFSSSNRGIWESPYHPPYQNRKARKDMMIQILYFSIGGYLIADFFTTREIMYGGKGPLYPAIRVTCGVISLTVIMYVVGHSGIVK